MVETKIKKSKLRINFIAASGNAVYQSILPKKIVESCGILKGNLLDIETKEIEEPDKFYYILRIVAEKKK